MDKSNFKSLLDHLCYIEVPGNTVTLVIAKFCDIGLLIANRIR